MVNNSSNGTLELKTQANIGTGNLTLTAAAPGLSVVRERGSTLKYIAQNGLTPLCRVRGIQHPFLGSLSLGSKGYDNTAHNQAGDLLRLLDFDERELD